MAESRLVRPLRWWTPQAMAGLSRRLEAAWATWCGGWGFERRPVVCANSSEASEAYATVRRWQRVGILGGDGIWIGSPHAEPAHWLQQGLFAAGPTRQPSPVASRVVLEAWQDLQHEIACAIAPETDATARSSEPPPSGLPAGHRLSWSGAVGAQLSVANGLLGALVVHIGPSAAAAHCVVARGTASATQARSPLASVADALGHRRVSLDVHLGEAEIELGMLQSLRIGDVVVLDHALHQPATVQWTTASEPGGRSVLFEGHLGRLGPCKAIETAPRRIAATLNH